MRLGSISSRPAAVAARGLVGTHLETRCMSGRWLAQCLLFSCLYWEASNSGDDRLGPTAVVAQERQERTSGRQRSLARSGLA